MGCLSFTCVAFSVRWEGCIRYRLAVFRGGPVGQGLNTTSAASIIDDYAPVERNGAYIYVRMGACICRARSLPRIFPPSEVAIVVATAYQHACRRVSGLRMPRGLFADDSLASVVSCRALSSFAQQRLVSFDIAAIVRGMISRCLSIARSELTSYCRRVNWAKS